MKLFPHRTLLLVCCLAFGRDLSAAPHPSLPPPVVPDCLGVNIHFTDPRPGELEMLAAAGFKWVRMDFGWAGTERKPGEYDFSAYDRLVAKLDEHKLRAVFILDYGNPLYAAAGEQHPFTARAGTPEFRDAYAKWAVAAVAHFKGRGYLWELWNEPNNEGFWKPKVNAAEYAALAKATGEALRSAGLIGTTNTADALSGRVGVPPAGSGVPPERPSSSAKTNSSVKLPQQVRAGGTPSPAGGTPTLPESRPSGTAGECFIGPATSTIDLPFIEECFKAGLLDYWDAVSVHPYRATAPETVEEEYRSLRLLIRRYAPAGKDIPVISGEWGYSTQYSAFRDQPPAARDELQAKWLAREFLTNMANDVALSIWYDWHDDGTDPKEAEHHFGLVAHEYHAGRDPVYDPKPAYTAMKTMTEQLGGFRFNKGGILHGSGRLVFDRSEREVRIVDWSDDPVIPLGNRDGKPAIPGGVHYTAPTTVTEQDQWLAIAGWSRLPLEYVVHAPAKLVVPFSLKNPVSTTWKYGLRTAPLIIFDYVPDGPTLDKELLGFREASELHEFEVVVHDRRQAIWQTLALGDLTFEQWSPIEILNPLSLELLAPGDNEEIVGVRNPSGEAFSGALTLLSPRLPKPFHFAKGERSALVHLELFPEERTSVALLDADGKTLFLHQFRKPQELASFEEPSLRIRTDGDRQVSAKASVQEGSSKIEPAPGQSRSLALSYQFAVGWKFAQLEFKELQKIVTPMEHDEPREFGLWLHGDGKGCQTRIRFKDSTGQVFQPDGPKIDWQGWRYVTFPMQSTEEKLLAHWGGKNDGVIHYPIEWDSIFLLDNVSRQAVEGEIYLSAPTLIY